jgi:hypothetical protein
MEHMGAEIRQREPLLDYLSTQFGPKKHKK